MADFYCSPCGRYEPCADCGACEMDRRARTGGATVLVLDGAATVTRVDDGGLLLQVTDYRGDESAAVVLTAEQAHDLAEALTGGKWAGKPTPEHPCTDYREDRAVSCTHADVRYCADQRGAVACFDCGRLFGHLQADDDTFVPYNPTRGHCEPHDLPLLAGHYCAMCRLAEMDSPKAC